MHCISFEFTVKSNPAMVKLNVYTKVGEYFVMVIILMTSTTVLMTSCLAQDLHILNYAGPRMNITYTCVKMFDLLDCGSDADCFFY